MRIFFIGTVAFSQVILEKLIELDAEIVGVATKSNSRLNSDHVNLAPICEEHGIIFKYVRDINAPHIINWIEGLKPDIIFCFGWSSLIKNDLLKMTKQGVIGFHPTELPYNRGRHPIIWSIVLGLKESATSFFFMNEGADEGDILSQKPFTIKYEDDAASVYAKVEENALEQIEEFLPRLENKTYTKKSQDLSKGNIWRKRSANDGVIDFRMNSYSIYNLVRALTKPYLGAHINYQGAEVKIWKVEEMEFDKNHIEPGKVVSIKDSTITVKTGDAAIKILEHDFKYLPEINEYL